MSTPAAEKSSTPAWEEIARQEDASLTNKCSKCGVCGSHVVSQYASNALQCAYQSNNRIRKCGCCNLCQSRALTTDGNYRGTACVSAARQTLCFWTKEQREQHFASVKGRVVAHGMEGRPCRDCCDHFGFSQSKK